MTGGRVRRDRLTPKPAQLFRKRRYFFMKSTAVLSQYHSLVPFPSTSRVHYDQQAVSAMTGQHMNQPARQRLHLPQAHCASPWYPSSRVHLRPATASVVAGQHIYKPILA